MIEGDVYAARMKAFMIDEAHCVKKWCLDNQEVQNYYTYVSIMLLLKNCKRKLGYILLYPSLGFFLTWQDTNLLFLSVLEWWMGCPMC